MVFFGFLVCSRNNIVKFGNKKAFVSATLLIAGVFLSGCVGGTTYGTGVTQEKQTLTDITQMLTFQKKRTVIDYSARPDLVVPENKQLVEPVDVATTTSNPDWPESPEQRIVRIRAEAEEAQSTNAKRVQFDQSKKTVGGTFRKMDAANEAPEGQGVPNVSCDPDGLIMRACTSAEISKAVRESRKIASSTTVGTQRRYLTEPPTVYRTPVASAPIGDQGYTEEELKKLALLEKIRAQEEAKLREN